MKHWWLHHRTQRRRRRSLTLIEMMVVIAIIALSAPMMGMGIYRGLKKERYEAGVRELVTQLNQAQQTMLYADRDMVVELIPGNDGVLCRLFAPSVGALGTQIGQARILPGVEKLLWNGVRVDGPLHLLFYSGGRVMSRGELTLQRGKELRTIRLAGYPHPLAIGTEWSYGEHGYEAYPEEVVAALSLS